MKLSNFPPLSFGGIISMSSVLTELPLPKVLPERQERHQSLLFHPRIAEEANKLLNCSDQNLASNLIDLITKTDCPEVSPINCFEDDGSVIDINDNNVPNLLKAIFGQNPSVFDVKKDVALPLASLPVAPEPEQKQVEEASPLDKNIPEQFRHLFPHKALVRLEQLPPQTASSHKNRESLPSTSSSSFSKNDEATRRKILSLGKQPKCHNQNRKKKDMVSELFDSLTPSAEYFVEKTRRRRTTSRLCAEDVYSRLAPNEDEIEEEKIASPPSVESSADTGGKSSPPPQNAKEDEEWREMLKRRKEKYKRRSSRVAYIDPKEIAENESYSRFLASIDNVFENVEDCDLIGDDEEIPSECLVSKLLLTELNSEGSKLRAVGLLHKVPVDRLTKLITILERNIKDGSNIALTCDEKVDDGTVLDLISDRVFRSLDAAILALTVMTSQGMPRQVYIEDAIERAAQLLKFQLINTVAPTFDPTYRTLKDVDQEFNPKSKKFKSGSSSGASKNKLINAVYGRLIELVSSFADLILMQTLPETTIMQLCSFGVASFFIDHLREFQLNSLRLLANIFNRYENCRKIILEEILISLARSPTSKKSSRIYKLSVDESIQMITALVLLLVQSAVHVPSTRQETDDDDESNSRPKLAGLTSLDSGPFALMTYDRAAGTAHTFLNAFLNKCRTKSEEDFRPLFEAFVEDLLVVLNKPEWPAAEIFLNLLGKLLIQNFSNKQTDVSLRVASLDYLGLIAARLRKDAVNFPVDEVALKNFIASLPRDENSNYNNLENNSAFVLQSALIDYLVDLKDGDPVIDFAKHYYIAEWYKDAVSHQESNSGHQKHKKEKHDHVKRENNTDQLKNVILSLVDRDVEEYYGSKLQHKGSALKESQAGYVVRYLASKRPLAQSFDAYLAHILRILNETTVSIRSKAMKCLAFVVEADPSILARTDVHKGVHSRLIDTSSSVREVVVDLIGKFVTAKPELIDQYYQMITDRILDTGLSVRKRVIKILREICEKQPDYEKCAEICVRLLRRMNDEESIRKLVCETFNSLWFTPVRDRDTVKLLKKVLTITDAVGACAKDGGQYEGFESLLSTLLCKEQDKAVLHAAKQIVNCLVENVLTLDERLADNDPDRSCNHQRMLNCLTTLYLFAKVKPALMVEHAQTMQPYLSMNATSPDEIAVLIQVIKILEMVVPLMDHPSTTFLSQVEDILIKLMLKSGQTVVQASISCLASIVNRLTKN